MEIHSLTNAKVKQWAKYKEKKHREQDHRFLVEGEHLIKEAHSAGLIEHIMIGQGKVSPYNGYECYEVTPEILRKLSDSTSGTWIMAVCRYPSYALDALGSHVILMDDIQDPGNAGTIIRTALSFGYDSVILSTHSVDIYNEKVIRSTQGAIFHIPVVRMDLKEVITQLKEKDIPIYVTALQGAKPMMDIERPEQIALVFGNEGNGVRSEIIELATRKVFIEMNTFESLNVAVAAGICMYHYKKSQS